MPIASARSSTARSRCCVSPAGRSGRFAAVAEVRSVRNRGLGFRHGTFAHNLGMIAANSCRFATVDTGDPTNLDDDVALVTSRQGFAGSVSIHTETNANENLTITVCNPTVGAIDPDGAGGTNYNWLVFDNWPDRAARGPRDPGPFVVQPLRCRSHACRGLHRQGVRVSVQAWDVRSDVRTRHARHAVLHRLPEAQGPPLRRHRRR
jgi:hypothetical protein